jgi:hypothetical protein
MVVTKLHPTLFSPFRPLKCFYRNFKDLQAKQQKKSVFSKKNHTSDVLRKNNTFAFVNETNKGAGI